MLGRVVGVKEWSRAETWRGVRGLVGEFVGTGSAGGKFCRAVDHGPYREEEEPACLIKLIHMVERGGAKVADVEVSNALLDAAAATLDVISEVRAEPISTVQRGFSTGHSLLGVIRLHSSPSIEAWCPIACRS